MARILGNAICVIGAASLAHKLGSVTALVEKAAVDGAGVGIIAFVVNDATSVDGGILAGTEVHVAAF